MKIKKLMLAFCLMLGAAVSVYAQDTTRQEQPQYQTDDMVQQDASREAIEASELPEPIKQSLASQDYSGYTVKNAYRKTETNGEVTYTVKLKSGSDTKKITYDAQGNIIKEKGKGKDDKDYKE